MKRVLRTSLLCVLLGLAICPLFAQVTHSPQPDSHAVFSNTTEAANKAVPPDVNVAALANVLVKKGVLTQTEADSIRAAVPGTEFTALLVALRKKGIVDDSDLSSMATEGTTANASLAVQTAAAPAQKTDAPKPPTVVAAVAPLRVLPVDPPKREGIIPDIKVGPVRLKPYGFFKASVVYDSSSPRGDDFPFPQFLSADTGPDAAAEFHIKARSLRLGTNFEWLDNNPSIVITGKLELDFEGNFSRVDNRNVSSIRSSAASIRLGWGRIDFKVNPKNTIYMLAGQDWTPFGSSSLPALVETTGVGIGFGTLYERVPQFRTGWIHDFGGSRKVKISPEFAIAMPAYGNLPTDVGNQLGYGERQGADSQRPEFQGRLVTQWQLDPAPGVAPAQIIFSGVEGRREAIVLAADVPAAYKAAFPRGVKTGSNRWGYTAEVQLPTRFLTLTTKYYRGADLRFYFGGQLYSMYNYTGGLTALAKTTSVDGSSTVWFGTDANGDPVVAPQMPVRSDGGFVNLGLPLSRWAHANPAGRNAGWTMYLHWGTDQAVARDVKNATFNPANGTFAAGRGRSFLYAGNIQWKFNQWITFAYEQSLYETTSIPGTPITTGTQQSPDGYPFWQGVPYRTARDVRSEFATMFNF